jgi:capsular polysaccharide biosynthesis protein
MSETVYILANAGNWIFMHWFLFTMASLEHIEHVEKPIKFHTNISEGFHKETIELLKPDYKYIEDCSEYTKVEVPYVCLLDDDRIEDKYYHFVRELILSRNPALVNTDEPTRIVYVSRNRSHLLACNNGSSNRRQCVNEDTFKDHLIDMGIEFIFLEDYSLVEKIKLYQTAKVIIATGGANTMAFFANPKTKIIEIHAGWPGMNQYSHIGTVLGNPFIRYTDVSQNGDCGDYLITDINHFIEFINGHINTPSA